MPNRPPPHSPVSNSVATRMTDAYRCGTVAIVGRPNAGKSTLLNRLVGQKVSITSRRPQTTRHRLIGIRTLPTAQLVYVDTPGIHPADSSSHLGRIMNRAARGSLEGVDVVVLVMTADGWRDEDDAALSLVQGVECPVVLAINKVDQLENRATLLPLMETSARHRPFTAIMPLSARTGENVPELERLLVSLLPQQPPLYDSDQLTDRSERFLAAEFVREQVFRAIGQEVPYSVAVEISEFRVEPKHTHIEAVIWVEKEGQKAIVIGAKGEQLKKIGRAARLVIQKALGRKVWLGLWVKVREGWADDARVLKSLGYAEDE
jgi:GTP-binding protein Era